MSPIKVVYNACYGGYSLSKKAVERLAQLGVVEAEKELQERASDGEIYMHFETYRLWDFPRHDPRLVQVVEELGEAASGTYANLQIHVLEEDRYLIDEYDGLETVREPEDISWVHVEN